MWGDPLASPGLAFTALTGLAVRARITADMRKSAVFSEDMQFRYALGRMWTPEDKHESSKVLAVIGLNPSTATEEVDDPTIRRCIAFAKAWGHHGLVMLNLFAYRATDPRELRRRLDVGADIIGGTAQEAALEILTGGRRVLCAWGAHGALCARDHDVTQMLHRRGRDLVCLGTTLAGSPKHPLYLRADTQPVKFP